MVTPLALKDVELPCGPLSMAIADPGCPAVEVALVAGAPPGAETAAEVGPFADVIPVLPSLTDDRATEPCPEAEAMAVDPVPLAVALALPPPFAVAVALSFTFPEPVPAVALAEPPLSPAVAELGPWPAEQEGLPYTEEPLAQ
jgi:hypothetical protein